MRRDSLAQSRKFATCPLPALENGGAFFLERAHPFLVVRGARGLALRERLGLQHVDVRAAERLPQHAFGDAKRSRRPGCDFLRELARGPFQLGRRDRAVHQPKLRRLAAAEPPSGVDKLQREMASEQPREMEMAA